MIDSKKITRQIQEILHRGKTVRDHNIMHPEREWFIGTIVAFCLLGGGVYWSINLYQSYSADEVRSGNTNTTTGPVIYREREVTSALELLRERAMEYEAAKASLSAAPVSTSPTTPLPPTPEITPEPATTTDPVIIPRVEASSTPTELVPEETSETPIPSLGV